MALYFIFPFGAAGDRATVPMDTQVDGSMSYEEGFGTDYQLDLATDPSALPIPRNQTNQLYYDITSNIQQYQNHGVPDFITSSDNGGSPFSYDIYARVRFDDGSGFQIYENQVDGNLTTPTDSSWLVISGPRFPPGVILDYAGTTIPDGGYLLCDGSLVLRATYPALYAAIGDLWGTNDGSTNFKLPDSRRRTSVGSGGTGTSVLGNATGNMGGSETITLTLSQIPSHNHVANNLDSNAQFLVTSPRLIGLNPNGNLLFSSVSGTGNAGGGLAHDNIQPSYIVTKIIKY